MIASDITRSRGERPPPPDAVGEHNGVVSEDGRSPSPHTRARPRRHFRRASYISCYNGGMGDTITFRPDDDAARALEVLTKDGTPVSTAVRTALIDAARRQATARLRAEAEELAADEQDRAEAAQVLRDMETLRAW
jgi:hypothetical protein